MNFYLALIILCFKLWFFHQIKIPEYMTNVTLLYSWCPHTIWHVVIAQEIHVSRMNVPIAYETSSGFWCPFKAKHFDFVHPRVLSQAVSQWFLSGLIWCCLVYQCLQLLFVVAFQGQNGHKKSLLVSYSKSMKQNSCPGAHQQILFWW